MATEHTPTPWHRDGSAIHDQLSDVIAATHIDSQPRGPWVKASYGINAAFIVRAVNNHAAMLDALKRLVDIMDEGVAGHRNTLADPARAILDAIDEETA